MKYLKSFEGKFQEKYMQDKLIDDITFFRNSFEKSLTNILNSYNLDFINDDGFTPLTAAVEYGRIEYLRRLLENGADINYTNDNGETPLIVAAKNNNCLEALVLLIENGADWFIKDNSKKYFVDWLEDEWLEDIKDEYPEKYQDYLIRKNADKYNI